MRIRLGLVAAAVLGVSGFVVSCGGSSTPPAKDAAADADGSATGAAGADAAAGGAGGSLDAPVDMPVAPADGGGADAASDATDGPTMTDGPPCEGFGSTCTTNAGAPCVAGRIACGDAGPTCLDTTPVADGTTCASGLCLEGACLGGTNVASAVDLSKVALTGSRICVEAAEYAVTALATGSATLAAAPVGDCLVAGDEVMLYDAQGTPADNAKVGTWELLTVARVDSKTVTFTTDVTRAYGMPSVAATATDGGTDAGDAGAHDGGADAGDAATDGGAAGPQKIVLARVPHFGALTVASGGKLTSAPWDGTTGGVLALRAATLQVDGTIDGASLGYRGGQWSQDTQGCSNNLATQAGESISGPGLPSTAHNVGGAGGIASASGIPFTGDTPIGASPGHAQPGVAGANADGRTLGQAGVAYGVADATRLTMGSGPGGNLTCGSIASARLVDEPGQGGGVVALFASHVTVSATGVVSASPPASERDSAYAGGYVLIRGDALALGAGRVTAQGSTAVAGSAPGAAFVNRAGDGYVVLDATGTIAGTTAPAAHVLHGTPVDGGTDAGTDGDASGN
jgi:hypothetical protein